MGMEALAEILTGLGLDTRGVPLPPGVLHLKSDCGLLDEKTVFATPRLAASGCFAGYDLIETPAGEAAAANLIRVNNVVLVAAGYPRTEALLVARGTGSRPSRSERRPARRRPVLHVAQVLHAVTGLTA